MLNTFFYIYGYFKVIKLTCKLKIIRIFTQQKNLKKKSQENNEMETWLPEF